MAASRQGRGILKPKSTNERGIFNKLSRFFNQYTLSGFEDNTEVEDLEKSIQLNGYNSWRRPPEKTVRYDQNVTSANRPRDTRDDNIRSHISKIRYRDGNYERGELPSLQRSNQRVPTAANVRFDSRRDTSDEVVKKLHHELRARTWDVKRLVNEVDDANFQLKKTTKELQTTKEENAALTAENQSLKIRNQRLAEEVQDSLTKLQQVNTETVKEANKSKDLQTQLSRAESAVAALEQENGRAAEEMLAYRLEISRMKYELKLSHLRNEYFKHQLIDSPKLHLKYYDQINDKLEEFARFIDGYRLSNQEICQQYDYTNISQLKIILNRLYLDLTKKFIRNSIKPPTTRIIHFLSLNYLLRYKCLTILGSLDKILTVLTYA